jgi:hypothetical protein
MPSSSVVDIPSVGGGDNQQAQSTSTIVVPDDVVGSHVTAGPGAPSRKGPILHVSGVVLYDSVGVVFWSLAEVPQSAGGISGYPHRGSAKRPLRHSYCPNRCTAAR